MRINVVGAGPAGLYVAILMKRADPRREILVVEREAAAPDWDAALSEELAGTMRAADYASYRAIADAPALLPRILRRRCAELGVEVASGHEVTDPATLADADLLIGADGVEGVVRPWLGDALSSDGSHVARFGIGVVLVGDAARAGTAGIERAIEDAIALAATFARHREVPEALAAYERAQMAGSPR